MGRIYVTLLVAPLRGRLCGCAFWHSKSSTRTLQMDSRTTA